ncbi:antitoxin VapB family protein [Natronorarus salvus]|uniref:antitoxin VapB family protein n=1 Tax=Natronorarus salvus TaxID=3117733 RepID=UPI002F26746E
MGVADEQIRVSKAVKREIERRRREGESYNDVLERVFEEKPEVDFYDGFGMLSDDQAESIREARRTAKERRKDRMRRLADESA